MRDRQAGIVDGCKCPFSIGWYGERVFVVSHGKLSRIFRLGTYGELADSVYPKQWLASSCSR